MKKKANTLADQATHETATSNGLVVDDVNNVVKLMLNVHGEIGVLLEALAQGIPP